MNAFVIKKKPFLYKLGARLFKWLVISNKVVEWEHYGKVIESDKMFSKYWRNKGGGFSKVETDELDKGETDE